jgi:hypothetical protein
VAPKDIVYRVLHQLRRFIAYDHGASVLGYSQEGGARVLARQVAWTGGRSDVVGNRVDIAPGDLPPGQDVSILTDEASSAWHALDGVREEGSPPKRSIMAGRLVDRDGEIGLVEISTTVPAFFLDNDVAALSRFLPYLAWCMRRMTDNPKA